MRSLRRSFMVSVVAVLASLTATSAVWADDYTIDPVHSGVSFKITHTDISWVFGRFNSFAGKFTLDPDPSKCSFEMTIQANSVDTNNIGRDTHLRGADYFNVKQFPTITFKSTSVKPIKDGYEVTGDFTMHGVTKPLTLSLLGGKIAKGQRGGTKTGFTTESVIPREEFGMQAAKGMLGNDVNFSVSFQGVKK